MRLEARELELLLYDWLSELIFLKDSERLIFPDATVTVQPTPPTLTARLTGGHIDPHTVRRADAKAVTLHVRRRRPWPVRA